MVTVTFGSSKATKELRKKEALDDLLKNAPEDYSAYVTAEHANRSAAELRQTQGNATRQLLIGAGMLVGGAATSLVMGHENVNAIYTVVAKAAGYGGAAYALIGLTRGIVAYEQERGFNTLMSFAMSTSAYQRARAKVHNFAKKQE